MSKNYKQHAKQLYDVYVELLNEGELNIADEKKAIQHIYEETRSRYPDTFDFLLSYSAIEEGEPVEEEYKEYDETFLITTYPYYTNERLYSILAFEFKEYYNIDLHKLHGNKFVKTCCKKGLLYCFDFIMKNFKL